MTEKGRESEERRAKRGERASSFSLPARCVPPPRWRTHGEGVRPEATEVGEPRSLLLELVLERRSHGLTQRRAGRRSACEPGDRATGDVGAGGAGQVSRGKEEGPGGAGGAEDTNDEGRGSEGGETVGGREEREPAPASEGPTGGRTRAHKPASASPPPGDSTPTTSPAITGSLTMLDHVSISHQSQSHTSRLSCSR